MSDKGYVNYFEVLGLKESANPGEVRKTYRREMKKLVGEIARVEITEERRSHFLLEMAKLNAALYILRDRDRREEYWRERTELQALEAQWQEVAGKDAEEEASDVLRKRFDGKLRHFLGRYVEETMLEAGRDKECVEASRWDAAHERHATRILRHYRHGLNHEILERLPFHQVTAPDIDWEERAAVVADLMSEGARDEGPRAKGAV